MKKEKEPGSNARETRSKRIVEKATKLYKTYTSGLKSGDFKRLFTHETRSIFNRFHDGENKKTEEKGFKAVLRTFGQIFWGFILALTPARRIIYGIAVTLFLINFVVMLTADYHSELRQDVSTLSLYSFIIASFLLALELADKLAARDEIEIAREIQLSLLPPENPNLPGLQVSSTSVPATDVGGDYYDFACVNGRVCLAIGDVSGHGLGSGLLMAMAKSAWQAQLVNDPKPQKVLSTLNKIVRDAGTSRTFMTFMHCVFEDEENRMVFANAGHIYPLHFRPSTGTADWLETPQAYPLGIRESQKLEHVSVDLQAGDLLFFISDGVVEAVNESGESYGYNRFKNAVSNCGDYGDTRVVLDNVLEDLQEYVNNSEREDDVTVIVARYRSRNE